MTTGWRARARADRPVPGRMSLGLRARRTRSLPRRAISSRWRTRVLTPSPHVIVGAVVLFAADQYVYQQAGTAVVPQALLDWTDHLLTTLFIVWALKPPVSERQLVPALLASVVIDVDHVPGELGSHILTVGTSRPYSHSLTTVAMLLVLAAARRDWGAWESGAALGVASHLWRDLAEPRGSGVALFWPVSDRTITTPAAAYLISIAVLAAIGLRGPGPLRTADRVPGPRAGGRSPRPPAFSTVLAKRSSDSSTPRVGA